MQDKTSVKIDEIQAKLGKSIRKLRIDKGLTQEEFCKKNNLKTAANLSAIEKGKTAVTLETLLSICHYSKISVDSLLFGNKPEPLNVDADNYTVYSEALERTLKGYGQKLNNEISRLQEEIKISIEKRDRLNTSKQAYEGGFLKLDDSISLYMDIKFLKEYIESLYKELEAAKGEMILFVKDRVVLLRGI